MERMHRLELATSFLLAAALVGIVVYAAWSSIPAALPAPFTPTPSFVLLPQNTSFVLPPGQERDYEYANLTSSNYLAGLFNVTPVGDCGSPCFLFPGIFLMNSTQFTTFEGGTMGGYLSGALYATNVSLFALLAPGVYHIVFWNGDSGSSNLSLRYTARMPLSGYAETTQPPVPATPPPHQTLLAVQSFAIGDGYHGGPWMRYDVCLPPTYWNYTISGAFSASGGTTTLYFFTPTQFTALSGSFGAVNMPSNYSAAFSVGPTVQGEFTKTVPAGSYILVFTNNNVTPGAFMVPSITVSIEQNITATAT